MTRSKSIASAVARFHWRPVLAVAAAGTILAAIIGPALGQQPPAEPGPELLDALRQGGHVIFLRHAETERDYADQVDAVMGDCASQRVLSEAGWHQARNIGGAFEYYDIPVGTIISSEYCRAWQTADLAFGRYEKSPDLNFAPAEEYNEAQVEDMRTGMMRHLTVAPAEGTNTVLVGHDDPFEAATGIYPEPMGAVYVIRPGTDGAVEIVGRIAPDAWPALGR